MMIRIYFKQLIFYIAVFLLMTGCTSEPPDLTAPEINILSFHPAPGAGKICGQDDDMLITIRPGDSLVIEMLLTDDQGLSQYKLDIHPNFDCHGHREKTTDWNVQQIEDLDGLTEVEKTLVVYPPDDVTAGIYHMAIRLVDLAGNEDQETRYYNLKVYNPLDTIRPELNLISPEQLNMQLPNGAPLIFSGTLTDNRALNKGGNARIELTYIGENSNLRFNAFKHTLSHISSAEYTFDIPYNIPQTLPKGLYFFTLEAFDGVNNPSEIITFEIEIVP